MRSRFSSVVLALGVLGVGGTCLRDASADEPAGVEQTALDAYVAKPDPAYRFELVRRLPGEGYTGFVLRLVSQTWLTEEEVDRPLWEHDLRIIVPHEVAASTALLFIGGGRNGREAPERMSDELAQVALLTRTVVAELGQVPNQPLIFKKDPKQRPLTEDALIAFGWDQYLRGGGNEWLARFPMTKSVVRAMDAVTAFCGGDEAGNKTVNRFVVAGGSKRGWTTWTTAAVDKRVVGIVPIVIDMLNVRPSFDHHYKAYGRFSPAVDDYVEQGIMNWRDTSRYENLLELVEPYHYRSRFTMPKLLLNATGDQFFLPDSSRFYFADLPGPKYLRYVPNADHSLKGTDAYETLLAFYSLLLARAPLPEFTWTANEGKLVVTAKTPPSAVRLWQATNAEARDFRLAVLGKAWESTPLQESAPGVYEAEVRSPAAGWTGYFVELDFMTPARVPLRLTTSVEVTPTDLPFPPFEPQPVGPTNP